MYVGFAAAHETLRRGLGPVCVAAWGVCMCTIESATTMTKGAQ